jgi:hypothetical protein
VRELCDTCNMMLFHIAVNKTALGFVLRHLLRNVICVNLTFLREVIVVGHNKTVLTVFVVTRLRADCSKRVINAKLVTNVMILL